MLRKLLIATLACGTITFTTSAASAASCFDLCYERNLIFAENGYCFRTSLGRRTFASYDCWTSNPSLSRAEQRRVAQIKREERRRGCNAN